MISNTLLYKISICSLALCFSFFPNIGQSASINDKAENRDTTSPSIDSSSSSATSNKNGVTTAEAPFHEIETKKGEPKSIWKFLPNGTHNALTPVMVSTSNSTPSQIKRSQKLMNSMNATNSVPLPEVDSTLPTSLPPSDMPQMAPIKGW